MGRPRHETSPEDEHVLIFYAFLVLDCWLDKIHIRDFLNFFFNVCSVVYFNLFSSFPLCLLCYSSLGWATEGREDGGTSSSVILFLRLDAFIDSASAASLLAEQTLNHIHSVLHPCHTHCEVCICVWLWLIFIFYGCSLRLIFLCCDVQFAIKQGVWNGELRSQMWCIAFWREMKFITTETHYRMETQKINPALSNITLVAVRCNSEMILTDSSLHNCRFM